MLKKIISIRNVGRFRNVDAKAQPQLPINVLIFGANGLGKTTLCAILRSAQTGDPTYVVGRKTLGALGMPEIELLTDNGTVKFKDGNWTASIPEIAIFDLNHPLIFG